MPNLKLSEFVPFKETREKEQILSISKSGMITFNSNATSDLIEDNEYIQLLYHEDEENHYIAFRFRRKKGEGWLPMRNLKPTSIKGKDGNRIEVRARASLSCKRFFNKHQIDVANIAGKYYIEFFKDGSQKVPYIRIPKAKKEE